MKRKAIHMLITVSVPANMSAAAARREVRELINHGTGWSTIPGYEDSVRARKVAPAPRKPAIWHLLDSDA